MKTPIVTAIMLVNGRPEMVQRALRSYRSQDYPNKRLLIYDSSEKRQFEDPNSALEIGEIYCYERGSTATIGTLRNEANELSFGDILIHFDSDDFSHPSRITEQVALLQASGKECVGYRDMLFWSRIDCPSKEAYAAGCVGGPAGLDAHGVPCAKCDGREYIGEAWVYTSTIPDYCLGTSLCYWRAAWQRTPFPDMPKRSKEGIAFQEGEDLMWQRGVTHLGVTSYPFSPDATLDPRMIAAIHCGNTLAKISHGVNEWERATGMDNHCRKVMAL